LFSRGLKTTGIKGEHAMPKPDILSFSELKKLRGQQKKPLVVYLDEKQFKTLVSGSKPETGKPNSRGVTITLAKLPLMPGGFVEVTAPGGKGPFIDTNGVIRAQRISGETDACAPVLTSDGIIVCKGSCGTGTSCGLAFAPATVALFSTSARRAGRLSTTVQIGGCGCR
jgi:hypothetical protein